MVRQSLDAHQQQFSVWRGFTTVRTVRTVRSVTLPAVSPCHPPLPFGKRWWDVGRRRGRRPHEPRLGWPSTPVQDGQGQMEFSR